MPMAQHWSWQFWVFTSFFGFNDIENWCIKNKSVSSSHPEEKGIISCWVADMALVASSIRTAMRSGHVSPVYSTRPWAKIAVEKPEATEANKTLETGCLRET